MSTCSLGYEHEDPEPEPIVVDDGTADAAEAVSDASVEVARIQADRDVTVAKIEHRAVDEELVTSLAAMQARLDVIEAAMAPPEPEPVVVVPEPAPEPEPIAEAPPETEHHAPKEAPRRRGFFS